MTKIAVLIPTRNRPKKVERLLESLTLSTLAPSQIIVISSGQSINSEISKFKDVLPITYIHTELVGQVAQKRLGIQKLFEEIEWCLFLDDDLVLERSCIQEAVKSLEYFPNERTIGIGLSLPVTSRATNISKLIQLVGSFFYLHSRLPGRVLKSGYASSYSEAKEYFFPDWLNGASMWKTSITGFYGQNLPSTKHASCEDLIFSYSMRTHGKLLYAPNAKVYFQDGGFTNPDNVEVMVSAAFWRYYFVSISPELSKVAFFKSQLGRIIFSTIPGQTEYLRRVTMGISTLIRLLIAEITKRDPVELLKKYVL
jgi:glycosyltransferase involved in cell wall biosynthesis